MDVQAKIINSINNPILKYLNPIKPADKLIDRRKTALLLIDIQEKLINVIPDKANLLFNIKKITDAAKIFDLSIFVTEQNPLKLGKTEETLIGNYTHHKYSKMSFSCIECINLTKELHKRNIKTLLICGIETHVCVLQSSLDLIRQGFNIQIIADATKSRNNNDHQVALSRAREAGAIITTCETAIFELCKTSNNQNFKEISSIVKRSFYSN